MGGCKCIFRNCTNNSANSPKMHFFHFPAKNKVRGEKWAKYAGVEYVLELETDKAKNKVVCATHFRDECFMNYKKDKIVKSATPTLVVLREDEQGKIALDYERSDNPKPTRIPFSTAKHLLPPEGEDKPILKRMAVEEKPASVEPKVAKQKDGIVYVNLNEALSRKKFKHRAIDSQENIDSANLLEFDFEMNLIKINDVQAESIEFETVQAELVPKQNFNNEEILQIQDSNPSPDVIDDKSEYINVKKHLIEELEDSLNTVKIESRKQIEELENQLQEKTKEIESLKSQLSKQKMIPSKPATNPKTSTQPNKEQLFQFIKKYLSSSMASLVRMEMFGNPEREWTEDEKQVSIELMQLGEPIFCYFRDEMRFRLPPQKDVETWLEERAD